LKQLKCSKEISLIKSLKNGGLNTKIISKNCATP